MNALALRDDEGRGSPGHKGHDDLTSSPPSSRLTTAVSVEFPALPDGNY